MASNTNFSVHETVMADMINQPNTHLMEAPAEDTLIDFKSPMCRDGTTTGRPVVVFGLPLNQSYFSRGKKADKVMASNTNFSVNETEMAGMINQSNTHQMEAPAEDTSNDLTPPMCRGGTTSGRVVVFGLPLDQSYFSRGKKALMVDLF